jgi:hypothetical protein
MFLRDVLALNDHGLVVRVHMQDPTGGPFVVAGNDPHQIAFLYVYGHELAS